MTRQDSLSDQELGLSEVLIEHPDFLSQDNSHAALDILQAVRLHLKMEVVFMAEFAHGRRNFATLIRVCRAILFASIRATQ